MAHFKVDVRGETGHGNLYRILFDRFECILDVAINAHGRVVTMHVTRNVYIELQALEASQADKYLIFARNCRAECASRMA